MARDRVPRRVGGALLPVVATLALLALVAAAVAESARGRARAGRLARARLAAAALADRARDDALAQLRAGAWRALAVVGSATTLSRPGGGDTAVAIGLGRGAWERLALHVAVAFPTGVPGHPAREARRLELPLVVPWPMPTAPLTGVRAWQGPPGVTGLADGTDSTRRCTDGAPVPAPAQVVRAAPVFGALVAVPAARVVDPDTVAEPLAGVVVLPPGRPVTRPLVVHGWLLAPGPLALEAPVTVTGMVVAAGPVETRGSGALRVTGAAWSLDSAGAPSRLRSGDTVHWSPCAVRRARDRIAGLAPVRTWGGADGR